MSLLLRAVNQSMLKRLAKRTVSENGAQCLKGHTVEFTAECGFRENMHNCGHFLSSVILNAKRLSLRKMQKTFKTTQPPSWNPGSWFSSWILCISCAFLRSQVSYLQKDKDNLTSSTSTSSQLVLSVELLGSPHAGNQQGGRNGWTDLCEPSQVLESCFFGKRLLKYQKKLLKSKIR